MEDLLDVFVEKQYDEIERASKSLVCLLTPSDSCAPSHPSFFSLD